MNIQRAAHIAASPDMAHVTFGGDRVYIQHVDEETGTARIYPLEHPEREQNVPVSQLDEQ